MTALPSDSASQDLLKSLQNNGIADPEFLIGILCQLSQISLYSGNSTEKAFLHSIVKGANPRSQNEVLLLVQMAATHDALIKTTRNLATARDPELVERFTNAVTKLTRAFAALMEVLHRCRSVNEKNINIQNVSIRENARAILGNVTHNALGNGAEVVKTPAIADHSAPAMPIIEHREKRSKAAVKRRHANDDSSQA
jgi:hypothetical protein